MKLWKKNVLIILIACVLVGAFYLTASAKPKEDVVVQIKGSHWFLLHRKSNVEYLYFGQPGMTEQSKLLKTFTVKTGIPGERPTPLPKLAGREYWVMTKKASSAENPETAPYFLTLDVPGWDTEPFGPTPYLECIGPDGQVGQQCNWSLPGEFGLHGVNGDETRLGKENPGSSGCIRHTDADITYLYKTLDPQNEEIRYYIEDL